MRKLVVTLIAVLLGAAWSVAPAVAADPADKPDKTESTKDKVKEKTESAVDKIKEKAHETKEKISEKMHRGDKAGEPAAKGGDPDVRAAQQALKDRAQDPGPIDGRMGPRTQAALKQFQRAEGLQATGTLDDATKDKLGLRGGSALPRGGTSSGTGAPGDAPLPETSPKK